MYELIQAAENTFYMDCPAKVGFYRVSHDEVVLIDSGSDKDAAKKVRRHLDAQGWKLRAIYNTHSHADHIGGNRFLAEQTGCRVFARGIERSFTESPILEPAFLNGGMPPEELKNKFLMAAPSSAEPLTQECLPDGLTLLPLPGHSWDMVGFETKDGVIFLADCLSSLETLEKYRIGYLYDPKAYIETLESVKTMQAKLFVPSHAAAAEDVAPLAQSNIDAVREIADTIVSLSGEGMTFDDLLSAVFDHYALTMTRQQYALVGSTVRSYLSWLSEEGRVALTVENNRALWRAV